MKKNIFVSILFLLTLSSCSDSFLDQHPSGGIILQDQYSSLDGTIQSSMLGIYSLMYTNGEDHDVFGQRSIDMYGDLLCGDMAMSSSSYGWFETDERMQTSSYRRGYLWSYYYEIIRLTNKVINEIDAKHIPSGFPTVETASNFTANDSVYAYCYGEALAMRGYAYSGLQRFFCKTVDVIDMNTELSLPVYTEVDTEFDTSMGQPRSTAADVYLRIESDLIAAIDYMTHFKGANVSRASKLEVDADVARALLAYAYLNKGDYDNAYTQAKQLINNANYRILPQSQLLTTGFSDVSEESWMWGQDVSIETTTGLASFFGQVDIHTYSYAWAGDIKAIDANLQASIFSWDGRKNWFDSKGRPVRKFYNVKSGNSTNADDIDRDWLNDNVFMRIESIYLIAAEAAVLKSTPDLSESRNLLKAVLDERVDTASTAQDQYNTYLLSLTTTTELIKAITYNWRVEMWGEGYGLQTFRRLTHTVTLGSNHLRTTKDINYTMDRMFTFEMPTSETTYNPYIGTELP